MSLRERIGNKPVWKVAIVVILAFAFMLLAIEEVFVSRIFLVLDSTISHFEKQKKIEDDEWEKDRKASAEFNKKWQQGFDDLAKKLDKLDKAAKLRKLCVKYLTHKKYEEFLIKHEHEPKDFISREIEKDIKEREALYGKPHDVIEVENAIKNKEFDPSQCKEGMS
jgi:hypothetical protein